MSSSRFTVVIRR